VDKKSDGAVEGIAIFLTKARPVVIGFGTDPHPVLLLVGEGNRRTAAVGDKQPHTDLPLLSALSSDLGKINSLHEGAPHAERTLHCFRPGSHAD